jgi:tetratricopeptide (TPR) repeat protein
MAFRHALIRDAFYGEIPWTKRVSLHRAVAQRLEDDHAAPAVVAEHWALGRQPDRARASLLAAAEAFCAVHAYRDGARAIRRALEPWPEERDERARLEVLERLARCAELAGDLGEAITAWREVADGHRREGDLLRLGTAHRRLAAALELQGRWQEALASREQAAAAFTTAGRPADAAAERLAAAAHLRSAASFRAALSLLETAVQQARAAGRVDLEARILGQEGNVRARMGEGHDAVALVRTGLAMALEHGLTGPAAEIYQRLADALEHAGDYPAAKETYDEAFSFCAANALEPTAQLCLACLTAVLRQSGDWDRAATLCRQVMASSEATFHARAVATGTLGSILGHRGQSRRARPLLLESVTLARRIELARWSCWPGEGSPSWTRQRARRSRRPVIAGRSWSVGGRPRTGITRSRRSAGRRPSSPSRGTVRARGRARRRWRRSPPTPARTRPCRRCRTRWARRRSWTAAPSRRPASSLGR